MSVSAVKMSVTGLGVYGWEAIAPLLNVLAPQKLWSLFKHKGSSVDIQLAQNGHRRTTFPCSSNPGALSATWFRLNRHVVDVRSPNTELPFDPVGSILQSTEPTTAILQYVCPTRLPHAAASETIANPYCARDVRYARIL